MNKALKILGVIALFEATLIMTMALILWAVLGVGIGRALTGDDESSTPDPVPTWFDDAPAGTEPMPTPGWED